MEQEAFAICRALPNLTTLQISFKEYPHIGAFMLRIALAALSAAPKLRVLSLVTHVEIRYRGQKRDRSEEAQREMEFEEYVVAFTKDSPMLEKIVVRDNMRV